MKKTVTLTFSDGSPSIELPIEEGTYGKPPQRTFVEDTFQKVWVYPQQGVTVYFGKDGFVEALTFGPGAKGAPKAPAAAEATPAGAQAGAAAGK